MPSRAAKRGIGATPRGHPPSRPCGLAELRGSCSALQRTLPCATRRLGTHPEGRQLLANKVLARLQRVAEFGHRHLAVVVDVAARVACKHAWACMDGSTPHALHAELQTGSLGAAPAWPQLPPPALTAGQRGPAAPAPLPGCTCCLTRAACVAHSRRRRHPMSPARVKVPGVQRAGCVVVGNREYGIPGAAVSSAAAV